VRRLRALVNGLRNLLQGSRLDRHMDDELAFHLECRAQDLMKAGLSADEAHRRARVEFGPIEAYKERTRDERRPRLLDDLARDLRYACRGLLRSPALVLTCVLSLGLGIGVNTTIFTALRSIIRHQATIANADRVVGVEPGNSNQFSFPNYRDLRESGIFVDAVAYRIVRVNLRTDQRSERVLGVATSGNFFRATGVSPRLGRDFASDEDAPERYPHAAVLTDPCWRRLFDGDPAVIGRSVRLNGEPFDIVGVLPPDYKGVMPVGQPDLYIAITPLLVPQVTARENANGLTVLARLHDHQTPQQAQVAVTRLGEALERQYPTANAGFSRPASVFPVGELPLRGVPPELSIVPVALLLLFGLVLLIACGNVAGLLLARATARRHEMAMRIALGARRGRLIQALLAEALVLGGLSAAGGLLLTMIAIPTINAIAVPGEPSMRLQMSPDRWLIAYAAFLGIATTIAGGLVPALHGTRVDVSAALQDSGNTRTTGRVALRHAFVIGQVAVSAFLLALSAMLMRTAARGTTVNPGFDIGSGAVVSVALPPTRSADDRVTLARELTARLAALPGVQSTSVATLVPLAGDVVGRNLEIRGHALDRGANVLINVVGPRYFETIGIALRRGREFAWTDRAGSAPVAIVNEAVVQRYFEGSDALGASIRTGDAEYAEIVGVVADTQFTSLSEAPPPLVYYSYAQRPWDPQVHVRVSGTPESMLRTLRAAADTLDAGAVVTVRTLRQMAGLEIAIRRGAAMLTAVLGLLGLLLSLIGLYGVMAYTVAAQRAELGVRMALGASPSGVVSLILKRGLRLVAIGALSGIAASLLVTFPARALLVGVSPLDPIAVVMTISVLLIGGFWASYLPARRAARVDPLVALRQA
jgi:putative ABC transport system permease protein